MSARDATIRITNVEVRQFRSGKREGKSYFYIHDGKRKFKTESETVAHLASELWEKGEPAELIYHEDVWQGSDGPVTTLVIDELKAGKVSALPVGEVVADMDKDKMSKSDWAEKEDREAWRIAWSVIYKAEREQGVEAEEAHARACRFAALVVTGAKVYANPDVIPFG